MTDDDLLTAAARIHDDLIRIARTFADAEQYKVAIQMQGFARVVVDEAEAAHNATSIKQLRAMKFDG